MLITRSFADIDIEVRSDGRTVHGIVAPFNAPAEINERGGSFTETIRHGAFARTISERPVARVKLLGQHNDASMPLGRAELLREDTAGLYGEFRISNTVAGNEALELLRDGALDAFSIGFTVPTNGARWTERNSSRELTEVKLHEVSLVNFPAYAGALVSGVRSAFCDPSLDPFLLSQHFEMTLSLSPKVVR